MEVNHKWMSARAYAKATGLGEEKVKQFIKAGKIEGQMTDDGYYKVKVYKDDAVSRKEYDALNKKYIELETKFKMVEQLFLSPSV